MTRPTLATAFILRASGKNVSRRHLVYRVKIAITCKPKEPTHYGVLSRYKYWFCNFKENNCNDDDQIHIVIVLRSCGKTLRPNIRFKTIQSNWRSGKSSTKIRFENPVWFSLRRRRARHDHTVLKLLPETATKTSKVRPPNSLPIRFSRECGGN